ncbi:WhiB family transcriptional regulator [Mycolicibacterium sphagni]|uniref:4Fe-4S Wbl-type domain-containing protein n=1 Tax=Mycolicibacterium sphagni TaxID=1786 RepID=A0A255DRL5_9MYCO|nr:WhiB family transcriptional regulator [Mycolicibacterium sphagni]OYN81730.1 hypothetical protein CG716_05085 [Mycolicibacterium sphagni]
MGLGQETIQVKNLSGIRTRLIPELEIPELPGAACKGVVTGPENDIFHPGPGAGGRNKRDAAKAMCGGCPVKAACLEYALDWDSSHDYYERSEGVWGGTTEAERKEILKGRNAA